MKYMLLIYSPENAWTSDEWSQCVATSMGICQELATEGKFLAASPLHPVATATTVRVRDGRSLITTGPFTETTEQLGGYYLIDVANLDEAIAIASRLPPAKKGTVEIRPIFKLDGLPAENLAPQNLGTLKKFMFLCYDDEDEWNAAGPDAHMASDQQEALAIAARHSGASVGSVEVRQVFDIPNSN